MRGPILKGQPGRGAWEGAATETGSLGNGGQKPRRRNTIGGCTPETAQTGQGTHERKGPVGFSNDEVIECVMCKPPSHPGGHLFILLISFSSAQKLLRSASFQLLISAFVALA